jgi:Trypsin-co-occurring domain 2
VRALRAELTEGVQEGYSEVVRFALAPVELDVEVQIERGAADGGIRYWVVADDMYERSGPTHRLRVNLTPTLASDTPGEVPLIVGATGVDRPR